MGDNDSYNANNNISVANKHQQSYRNKPKTNIEHLEKKDQERRMPSPITN